MVLAYAIKKFHRKWISSFFYLYINTYPMLDEHTHGCHWQGSFYFVTLDSLYIKYLHSVPKLTLTISNNMWLHVFISLLWLYITCFGLCIWLIFYFSRSVSIVDLILIRGGVGIHREFIFEWIESTPSRIGLWDISCPIMNQNWNTTWRSISKIA